MGATLEDVAQRAQVSHMTVSLVVNNKGQRRVSEATRVRVLAAAREVGYLPNRAAQALASGGRTQSIAVWIRRFSSPFYGAVASALEKRLASDKYEIIVRGCGADQTPLAEWPVDGIIAIDNAHTRPVTATELRHKQTAFVSAGVYCNLELDHVAIDHAQAVRDAVQHLSAQGCRRVAHILNRNFDIAGDSRRQAYLDAVTEMGGSPEIIVLPDDTREAVDSVLTDYVQAHGCPDGLFCRNDEIAIGAYRTLRTLGYRIPEDVCLVGCDGTSDTAYFDTPITTIETPVDEMCALSWDFLRRRMQDKTMPMQQATLHSQLRIRQSSRRQGASE